MSGYIGPKSADVPVGTIATKGTLSGNSLVVGTNNAVIGNAVYVVANGNVGIGISSPVYILDSYNSSGAGTSVAGWFHGNCSNAAGIGIQNDSVSSYGTLYSYGNTGFGISGWANSFVIEGVPATGGNLTLSAYSGNMILQTGGRTERMRITSDGKILHGTITNGESAQVLLSGAKSYAANIPQNQLAVLDTTNMTTGVGGAINLIGKYTSSGLITSFASIEAYKENSIDANYNAAMVFKTRAHGLDQYERMRISANGNVGIGTDSPSSRLHVANEIRIGRTDASAEGGEIKLCRSTDDAAAYSIDVYGSGTNPELRMFNSIGGTVFFSSANSGVNYIKFNPSQAAQGDANCLDDYEEGTWSPVMVPGSGTFTSTSTYGKYTKIGRTVFIVASCQIVNVGSATGSLKITSLPFTMRNSGSSRPFSAIVREDQSIGYAYQAVPNPNSTETFIGTLTNGDVPLVSNYLYTFSATYITD